MHHRNRGKHFEMFNSDKRTVPLDSVFLCSMRVKQIFFFPSFSLLGIIIKTYYSLFGLDPLWTVYKCEETGIYLNTRCCS